MKNVRVWYSKDGACRFISHLDINRTVTRALQMSGIPLWHTEGFNSRLYVSFALPLSLGFRGEYESVDIRLLEDDYPYELIIGKLNGCLPLGLKAYEVSEPVMKPADICYARFKILLTSEKISSEEIFRTTNSILASDSIIVEKKTKKGDIKQVDIKASIAGADTSVDDTGVEINVTLPAGSANNVNPTLLTDEIEKACGAELFADITREILLTEQFQPFR